MSQAHAIYIGIKGTVLALDGDSGQEIWRTELKGADFVNLSLLDGTVYAATKGEIWALDPASGEIRWHNPLKGLGLGLVSIAPSGVLGAAEERRRRAAAAAAGAGAAAAS